MKVIGTAKNSVGEELGIQCGDEWVSVNGQPVVDILDYEYCESLDYFTAVFRRGGEELEFEIEKSDDETLGLEFSDELKVRRCRNKCIFCFVDQLPKKELRKTLRVKDDDYRHSFLTGTYITLTNLNESDIERIIRLKLSPLYISVHSTDDEIRNTMLGCKRSFSLMPLIKRLSDGGIDMHTQIVYCPGFNEDLESSVTDLMPYCRSLAIVPVGLTKDANPRLKPVDRASAARVTEIVGRLQAKALAAVGTRFVWAADEFYIKAKQSVPDASTYEDFCQIENGVGLIAQFSEDFECALSGTESASIGSVSIATGESAFELISACAKKITKKLGGQIDVFKIRNLFFGESVTVAGLVTGGDIYSQLKGVIRTKTLVIPSVMLRETEDVFLDGMSVARLEELLNVRVCVAGSDGESLIGALCGTE